MSRTSRVPYHQNVYDLLGIEPGESLEAAKMIAAHEAQYGPLPASVREWYLVPNAVHPTNDSALGTLWQSYTDGEWPHSVREVLRQFVEASYTPSRGWVCVIREHFSSHRWLLEINGSDDPPVWDENRDLNHRAIQSGLWPTFSKFVADWISRHYVRRWCGRTGPGSRRVYAIHANGFWLRTPAESFAVPIIDFLTEQLGEPERTPRPGDVTTYTYRPEGGTIRVTADHPAHPEPLSAWWVHADTADRLAEFAQLLLPWGALRDTLRADTEPARDVWNRVRGA